MKSDLTPAQTARVDALLRGSHPGDVSSRVSNERRAPWPPAVPIQPSLYGLRIARETDPLYCSLGGGVYGEATNGGGLTARHLDILKAIAGGCPVDQDDPGVAL